MRTGSVTPATALAAALFLCAGCGGSDHTSRSGGVLGAQKTLAAHGGWASPRELRWLRAYGVWQDQIAQFAARAGRTEQSNGLTAALTPLANCGLLLRNDVGPAPTRRLQGVEAMLERACSDWRQAGFSAIAAGSNPREARLASVRRRVVRAMQTMSNANALLPPGEGQALPSGMPSSSQSRVVPLFSRVATRLAGRPAEVRCWTSADWTRLVREEREISVSRVDRRAAGITSIAAARENLRPEICARLAALAAGKRPTGEEELRDAFALLVLAHESQHAAGVTTEVAADCRGMQAMRRAGVLLGVPGSYAQRLAEDYWRMYPQQPRIYFSDECRNGGRLDLRPGDPRWP
jgi:hypothetical protein